MGEWDSGRSRQLDEVRQMLFPTLSPEEGRARIDAAVSGQSDPERWAAIERIVAEERLDSELLMRVRQTPPKQ
jgi:plasmid stability protein